MLLCLLLALTPEMFEQELFQHLAPYRLTHLKTNTWWNKYSKILNCPRVSSADSTLISSRLDLKSLEKLLASIIKLTRLSKTMQVYIVCYDWRKNPMKQWHKNPLCTCTHFSSQNTTKTYLKTHLTSLKSRRKISLKMTKLKSWPRKRKRSCVSTYTLMNVIRGIFNLIHSMKSSLCTSLRPYFLQQAPE